jgi:hypothetical protein
MENENELQGFNSMKLSNSPLMFLVFCAFLLMRKMLTTSCRVFASLGVLLHVEDHNI